MRALRLDENTGGIDAQVRLLEGVGAHSIDQDRDRRLWAARRSYARYRQVVA